MVGLAAAILSVTLICLSHLSIGAMGYVIYLNKSELNSKDFKERYGDTLNDGLTLKGLCGTYWNILVLLRWSVTVFVMVLLRDYYTLQILSLLLISFIIQALLVSSNPFSDLVDTRMALFNEVMVSLYLYVMLNLTDFSS